MSQIQQITEAIIEQGILPLYFNADKETSLQVMRSIYAAGIRAVEYTNRGDAALANFREMVSLRNAALPGLLLGVGTIKNMGDAQHYLEAGADFLVSPGFVPEVAAHCMANDIFYAPGCMTPTEIIAAENAGIRFIKLFPGDMLGPKFLSSIKDIFPKLKFMPTGGVDTTKENIEAWFKAGVVAVGMGSKLISKSLMAEKAYDTIETATREVLVIVKSVQNR